MLLLLYSSSVLATVQPVRDMLPSGDYGVTGFCFTHEKIVSWNKKNIKSILKVCTEQKWEKGITYSYNYILVAFIDSFATPVIDNNEIVLINAASGFGQSLQFDYAETQTFKKEFISLHVLELPTIYVNYVASGVPLNFRFFLKGRVVDFVLTTDEQAEISAVLNLKKF